MLCDFVDLPLHERKFLMGQVRFMLSAMWKLGGVRGLLWLVMATPQALHAQASVYGEGSASELQGGPGGDYLYGGTAGLLFDGPTILKKLLISGDIEARYVGNAGERLVGVAIGPRISFAIDRLKLNPYGEFMVGFARYRPSTAAGVQSTTDSQWQANMGLSRRVAARLDVVADYSYSQYGTNDGQFNPKSYSAGVIVHLSKR